MRRVGARESFECLDSGPAKANHLEHAAERGTPTLEETEFRHQFSFGRHMVVVACVFDAHAMPIHVKAWQAIAMFQIGDATFPGRAPQTPGNMSPVPRLQGRANDILVESGNPMHEHTAFCHTHEGLTFGVVAAIGARFARVVAAYTIERGPACQSKSGL